MTPLQEAARAVRHLLELAVCKTCWSLPWRDGGTAYAPDRPPVCPGCGGCGVNVSSPYDVGMRGMMRLTVEGRNPEMRRHSICCDSPLDVESHDGTPEGVATACLRLVARLAP